MGITTITIITISVMNHETNNNRIHNHNLTSTIDEKDSVK